MPPNERRRTNTIFNYFRNKHARCEIAIGDAVGSSVIDAGFSIEIGTLFFPSNVTASLAEKIGLYALMCSIAVVTMLALWQRHDRKPGSLFIALYAFAYLTLFALF